MKKTLLVAVAALSFCAYPAQAQTWSAEQTEVWQAVSGYWDSYVDNSGWHHVMTADSYGWGGGALLPRSREQMADSARVFGSEGKVLHHQLDPLAITVHGDVALVHYMAQIVETDYKDERETNVERCSDTMVRENGRWMFLGWGCADMGDDD